MKKIWIILLMFLFMACSRAPVHHKLLDEPKLDLKQPLYTAYNIWVHKGYNMECINWKRSEKIIPAGTPIKNLKIIKQKETGNELKDFIRFKVKGEKYYYKIGFKHRFHPRKSIKDYKEYMFTNKTFDELTAGLSMEEIAAIKNGVITDNMSKRAVLISWGIPPEHRTRSLDNNTWFYWMDKFVKKQFCFDHEGYTVRCH